MVDSSNRILLTFDNFMLTETHNAKYKSLMQVRVRKSYNYELENMKFYVEDLKFLINVFKMLIRKKVLA